MVRGGGRLATDVAELASCTQGAALEGPSPASARQYALARKSGIQFARRSLDNVAYKSGAWWDKLLLPLLQWTTSIGTVGARQDIGASTSGARAVRAGPFGCAFTSRCGSLWLVGRARDPCRSTVVSACQYTHASHV